MQIGRTELKNNIFLAPLAGVSDVAYRHIAGKFGAGLCYTEMVSSKAIIYKNKNTVKLLDTSKDSTNVAVQLFGNDPDIISESIKMIEDYNFCIIDFNMGCPVPKVVNNGEGSALLKNPKLVYEIVSKAKRATNKPFTVKIRKGFNEDNSLEIARVIEQAGADAIAIHARTRSQYYSGCADWDVIARIKQEISIPVIGNGDVNSFEKYEKMIDYTKCDAVMIGRGAQGNPFIFKHILNKEKKPEFSIDELVDTIKLHAELLLETKGERVGYQEIRKHLAWYTKGLYKATELRRLAMQISTHEDLNQFIENIKN